MRKILLGGICLSLLLQGCSSSSYTQISSPLPSSQPIQEPKPPPEDRTWVSPAKVEIGNFHLGARAEWVFKLHNGGENPRTFSVKYMTPNSTDKGYYVAPKDVVQNWVLIADMSPVMQGRETKSIQVTVEMPNKISEDEAQFLYITPEGTKYLSDLRLAYFKELYPSSLDKYTKKYVDKVNWKYVPKEPISSKSDLLKYLDSVGAPLQNFPELVDQTLYAMAYSTTEASGLGEERLEKGERTALIYLLEKERSISNRGLKRLDNYSLLTSNNDAFSNKYVGSANLVKDKWEFWIVAYDQSQTGMVTVEMASRWLVSMRG